MLSPNHSYHKKWEGIFQQTLFPVLRPQEKDDVRQFAYIYCLTLQELRQLVEWTIDFRMWGKGSLSSLWRPLESQSSLQGRERKKWMLQQLKNLHAEAKKETVQFSLQKPKLSAGYKRSKIFVQKEYVDDKILGMCPVASEKTVCCNLRTLDAVKNCGFGCSYCSIQTMFTGDKVIFDEHLEEKLEKIQLDPHRSYHIGTGQSSDALLWGNQFRLLDALVRFAKKWPNVILEFKTKSKNIKYFLKNEVPSNIFCSWSLN
ncbi:MAG: DNA photolyase, partial [Bdellovibrio sp.]